MIEEALKTFTADRIALAALGVAVLSALYARWTAQHARQANAINLFERRQAIYDALLQLRMHMAQKSHLAEAEEVRKFYQNSNRARTCLPYALSRKITAYHDACFEIAQIHRNEGGLSPAGMARAEVHIEKEMSLSPVVDRDLLALLQEAAGVQAPLYRRMWDRLQRPV